MGWHLLETLLQQVGEHSTLVGKFWVTATFVFRFVIVASVADAVYSDEQSDFNCNTAQPGCENVCFNFFSPISHLRFWAAQILAVCTPSIVFIVYAAHVLLKTGQGSEELEEEGMEDIEEEVLPPEPQPRGPRKRKAPGRMPSSRSRRSARPMVPRRELGMVRGFANPPGEATEIIEEIKEEESEEEITDSDEGDDMAEDDDVEKSLSEINRELEMLEQMEKDKENAIKRKIQFVYVITLMLRTGSEAIFIWLQYVFYGFTVPESFDCERIPCPKVVVCYVSRPTEKTYLLWFMFVVSCICLLLNIVEIHYLGLKKLFKILCTGSYGKEMDGEEAITDSKETDVFPPTENNSKGSKKFFMKIDEATKPSAPPGEEPMRTAGDYNKKKNDDPIGFEAIGNQPPYATPGYPFVHRYGMYLNATPPPPPPQPKEPEKYYL